MSERDKEEIGGSLKRIVWHPTRYDDRHPEATCQRCGGPNVVWFAPNDVWNRVMRDEGGILCPTCFIRAADAAGIDTAWSVAPEVPSSPDGAKR